MLRIQFSWLLFGLLLCAGCRTQSPRLEFDPQVERGVFQSGMKYLLRENAKPDNRVMLRLVIDAGSVLEEDNQKGLAHFVEHMAFNGSTHFEKQELVDYLESIGVGFGADLNAYTSFDETVYMLQIPVDNEEVLEKAFLVMQDWAQGLLFADEEIDKERGVIVEEWRRGRGAERRISDQQYPVIFKNSRYAERLPIGDMEVVRNAAYERLITYYKDWYRPDLMTMIVVGDLPLEKMEGLVKKYFADGAKGVSKRPREVYTIPDHEETYVSIVTDPESVESRAALLVKLPFEPMLKESDLRKRMRAGLIQGMLNERLEERRLGAMAPYLSASAYKGPYLRPQELFALEATVLDGGHLQGLSALVEEFERVKQHGFTASELERQKLKVLSAVESQYKNRDTTESASLANQYIRSVTRGQTVPGIEATWALYQRDMGGISLEEVNGEARSWMPEKNRVVLIEGPEKEGLDYPSESEVLAQLAHSSSQALSPYEEQGIDALLIESKLTPGVIVSVETNAALAYETWILSNGAKVVLKRTEFKADEILFSAFSPGGHSLIADDQFIAGVSADAVIAKGGLGSFSKIDLDKKLSGRLVSLKPTIQEFQESLSGGCAPSDLETLLQMVHLYFTKPRVDEDSFAAYVSQLRSQYEHRLSNPEAVFSDLMQRELYQNHFRKRPWTVETVDEMDKAKSLTVFRQRFSDPADFVFQFVGAVDREQLKAWVCEYIGSLPSAGVVESWKDTGVRLAKNVQELKLEKGIEPKSLVVMKFFGPMDWSYGERYRMRSMLHVLNIKLREKVREELGGTYHVSVYPELAHFPEPNYQINVVFNCAPTQVESLKEAVNDEINKMKTALVEPLYIEKTKEHQLRQRETSLKENSFWHYILQFYEVHEENPEIILEYENIVNALDAQAIMQSAKDFLGTPNVVVCTLNPEGGVPVDPREEERDAPLPLAH